MFKLGVKSMWARRRRLVGTFLAVFVGVAFLTGTLVLGDTLRANFDELFTVANQGTDAVVRSAGTIEADGVRGGRDLVRQPVSRELVERVRSVEGVAAAVPYIEGYGRLIGADGEALGGNGPPTLAASWVDNPDLNPYRIVEGRAPAAPDEVVVNRGAARDGKLHVGDVTTVETPEPVRVRIVGIATFGSSDGLGRVTFTAFTLDSAAEHIGRRPGMVSTILVKGQDGVSETALARRIRGVVPPGVEVITGSRLVKEATDDIDATFLDLLRTFLLVFAGVALLVATFSIYNTFSILVAQRTRESALVRALGATRAQTIAAFAVEALVVGSTASLAGLVGGVAIAGLLKGMFDAFGFSLPAGGLALRANAAVIAVVTGVVVTVLAGVGPAVRAARVPPLAALRDVTSDRGASGAARSLAGGALIAVGVAAVSSAVIGGGDGVLGRAGIGALVIVVGLVVFGPVIARRAAAVLGAPLPRLRGVTGALARENAMRNPRRTAGTASALMVGVGVVTLFTVFAASLKASISEQVSRSFGGDLAISSGNWGGGGLTPQLADDVASLPEVRAAVGLGRGLAAVDGSGKTVTVADPSPLTSVLHVEGVRGSIDTLRPNQLAVSDDVADDEGWTLGQEVPVRFPDGVTDVLTIGAVFEAQDALGDYLIPRETWEPHSTQDVDSTVLVALDKGVGLAAGRAAIERVAARYGAPDVQDRAEYAESSARGVSMLLGIVYVLLALAIVIATMGIANTLSLSIHERTRELGLLRAVGQTRGQLRSMVRWEAVVLAGFGSAMGVALGLFLGWALVQAASSMGVSAFAAPPGRLAIVLAAGSAVGVIAGVRPARRAARQPVLAALAYE